MDGLQQLVASSAEEVQNLMSEGSKSRTVAATKMNAESSRSHAVFTLIVTHSISDKTSGVSKILLLFFLSFEKKMLPF